MVTVTARLADLLLDGLRLDYTDPARPEFRVLPHHRAEVAALLAPATRTETQHALRAAADYRGILLRIFDLIAQDADTTTERQEQCRLHDDLGPRLAEMIGAAASAEYSARTQRCAYCGGPEHSEGDR